MSWQRTSSTDDSASDSHDDNVSISSFSSCGTVGLAGSRVIIGTKVMPIYEGKNVFDKQESLDLFTKWFLETEQSLMITIEKGKSKGKSVAKYEEILRKTTQLFNKFYAEAEAHVNELFDRLDEEIDQQLANDDEDIDELAEEFHRKIALKYPKKF